MRRHRSATGGMTFQPLSYGRKFRKRVRVQECIMHTRVTNKKKLEMAVSADARSRLIGKRTLIRKS
jgi:hypothetical protein